MCVRKYIVLINGTNIVYLNLEIYIFLCLEGDVVHVLITCLKWQEYCIKGSMIVSSVKHDYASTMLVI